MCYKKIRGADSWKRDCSSRSYAGKLGQRHRKWGQLMSDGKLNWTVGSRTVVGRNSAIFKSYGQVCWWNWYDLQEEIKKDPRSLGFTAGDTESYPWWFDSAWAILFGPELSLCHVHCFVSNSSDLLPFLIMMAKFWVSTWLVLSPVVGSQLLGCSDIWLNIISGCVSAGVSGWGSIESGDCKADCLHQCRWASPRASRTSLQQKG